MPSNTTSRMFFSCEADGYFEKSARAFLQILFGCKTEDYEVRRREMLINYLKSIFSKFYLIQRSCHKGV